MRVAPVVVALLGTLACGGASAGETRASAPTETAPVAAAPVAAAPTALRFDPPPGITYAFERTSRTSHDRETTEHVARGTWTPTSATESALHVESNGESWSHAADAALHFDARGLVTDTPDHLEGLPELDAMGLVLAPIGPSGVALPLEEADDGALHSVVSLAPLAVAGFPAELPVTCTLGDENGGRMLTCHGGFSSPPTEHHAGWLTGLSYTLDLHATLDAHGVALRSEQHIVSDITQQQLEHVEHEGGESTVVTVLRPL